MPHKDPIERAKYLEKYGKEHYKRNREKRLAQMRAAYLADPEKFKERAHRQYLRRKEDYLRRYKERKKLLQKTPIDSKALRALYTAYKGLCAYCSSQLKPFSTQSGWDHVVPLSKGGEHVITNVVPCCWPCNQQKATKLRAELRE